MHHSLMLALHLRKPLASACKFLVFFFLVRTSSELAPSFAYIPLLMHTHSISTYLYI